MSSIGKLMKQAQRMQAQMEQVQTALNQRTVEATSGGGAVKVIAKCDAIPFFPRIRIIKSAG